MKTKWLLENDVFDEDLQPMIDEIERQGMEVKVQRHRPFDVDREHIRTWYKPDDCVVFYGSIEFARAIQRLTKWIPGTYCSFDRYRCVEYYPSMGDMLVNADYAMVPFGDLGRRRKWLYDTFGVDKCIFIRPDDSDKIFTGKTVKIEEFERDIDLFGIYDTPPHELCVVSSPKAILQEWRLVIVENKIVAASRSKTNGKLNTKQGAPDEVLSYGRYVLKTSGYNPDRAWTLDLCLAGDETIKVMEVGSFSVAGLYACDMEPIIKSVSKVALDEWSEYNEDDENG